MGHSFYEDSFVEKVKDKLLQNNIKINNYKKVVISKNSLFNVDSDYDYYIFLFDDKFNTCKTENEPLALFTVDEQQIAVYELNTIYIMFIGEGFDLITNSQIDTNTNLTHDIRNAFANKSYIIEKYIDTLDIAVNNQSRCFICNNTVDISKDKYYLYKPLSFDCSIEGIICESCFNNIKNNYYDCSRYMLKHKLITKDNSICSLFSNIKNFITDRFTNNLKEGLQHG